MIFSKKLRKTAACVLTLVMLFAMSTGALAAETTPVNTYTTEAAPIEVTAENGYYDFTVNYVVAGGTLPEGAQVSIIALGGYAVDTPVADVKVTHDGNTATNVLWIDQYDATVTNGSVKVTVAESEAIKTAGGFWIKSGITGGDTIAAWVAVEEEDEPGQGGEGGDTPVTPPVSTEVGIDSTTVAGKTATLNGTVATVELDAALTDPQTQIVVAKKDANAQVAIAVAGENTYTITVTNGGATATYTLNVTINANVLVVLYGDANGDGSITGIDASLVAQKAGKVISQFTNSAGVVLNEKVGDVNGDGSVTGIDASLVAQKAGKVISEFKNAAGEVLDHFINE